MGVSELMSMLAFAGWAQAHVTCTGASEFAAKHTGQCNIADKCWFILAANELLMDLENKLNDGWPENNWRRNADLHLSANMEYVPNSGWFVNDGWMGNTHWMSNDGWNANDGWVGEPTLYLCEALHECGEFGEAGAFSSCN